MSNKVPPPPPNSGSIASICGFDIGSENCYVAVARAGGIEILLNEYSQRLTPAYVAFGERQRELGVAAKQTQMMNLSNTCYSPSRLIGRQFKELNEELPFKTEQSPTGEIQIRVWHNGEEQVFTATQIMAMLLTKLKTISSNTVDCVLNCPNYFTDSQRRALIDAAFIAGLNPLRIVPDMTAIGLYYGFYRTASSGQDINIVGFVDSGHTSTQCSVVLFNNKENVLRVLATEYDANLGGKHFDEILGNYFIKEHKLQLNKRAKFRILAECEKLKKQMSANSNDLPINIECLQDDKDFSSKMNRVLFEELAADLLKRYDDMFKRAFQAAREKFDVDLGGKAGEFRIDSVEIVGGTSRTPAIKRLIKDNFGVEASTTLNADEAVARGCALQCAMLSPTFKVARQFQVVDYAPYQINCRYWHVSPAGEQQDFKSIAPLFPRGSSFPQTKQISISCHSLPIHVAFDFVNDSNQNVPIGEFKLSCLQELPITKNQLKLRVRLDPSGIVVISSATLVLEEETKKGFFNWGKKKQDSPEEKVEKIENDNDQAKQDQSNANQTPMETEEQQPSENNEGQENNRDAEAGDKAKGGKKAKASAVELINEALWLRGKLTESELNRCREIEVNLILADKVWKERLDAKNALEEYIYDWRDKLESESKDPFISPNEKEVFLNELRNHEQWLYEQEDLRTILSKSVYEEKLAQLKKTFSDGVMFREREFQHRPILLETLGQKIQQVCHFN